MTMQGPSFIMQQPGAAPRPGDINRGFILKGPPQKKCGLLAMRPDSMHDVTIGEGRQARRQKVTAKDRRAFPNATGKFFCVHPECRGRWFDSEDALRKAHFPQPQLEAASEVHLYGFWSNDPVNEPLDDCVACAEATKKASAAATAAARKASKDAAEVVVLMPCAEHAGGVIGLLTPTDPNLPSA